MIILQLIFYRHVSHYLGALYSTATVSQWGPAVNTLGWPLATIFVLLIAAGMSELASAIPLSGGLYHWAYALGGRGWGWFTAWFNIIGQFAIIAGVDFGCSTFLVPLLGLPQTWSVFLTVYAVLLLTHALLNHYGIKVVAKLNDLSAVYHMAGVAVLIAALLIFGPRPNIAHVFQLGFTTSTSPYWLAFMLGLLQAQWTYTGYDGSCNMTEETVNPRIRGAWGIYMSVLVSIEGALGGIAGQIVLTGYPIVGVFVLLVIYYFASARKSFKGPGFYANGLNKTNDMQA